MWSKEPPGELPPPGAHGWGCAGVVAIRKAKTPGWTPCAWERVGDDSLFRGSIETRHKNGKPKWTKPYTAVVVTAAEIDAEEDRYEREHERCRACFGRGTEWTGWSKGEGNRYKPCRRCSATGRPIPISPPLSADAGEGEE